MTPTEAKKLLAFLLPTPVCARCGMKNPPVKRCLDMAHDPIDCHDGCPEETISTLSEVLKGDKRNLTRAESLDALETILFLAHPLGRNSP